MTRRALLIHGLSSNHGTWWRLGEALQGEGWHVSAPDLRGHGDAPPATRYRFDDYASDLPAGPFDLVVGHSLGGAIAVVAGLGDRIVLLDPVLEVSAQEWDEVRAEQVAELELTEESLRAAKPHWHERDLAHKLAAVRAADPRMVERTFDDNPGWNVIPQAQDLAVPTLILGGDPAVYSMLSARTVDAVTSVNPRIEFRVIEGAGHSPHRDRPEQTIAAILEFAG
jgi:pimeloyl-ACP methyl ester carboxylesterase